MVAEVQHAVAAGAAAAAVGSALVRLCSTALRPRPRLAQTWAVTFGNSFISTSAAAPSPAMQSSRCFLSLSLFITGRAESASELGTCNNPAVQGRSAQLVFPTNLRVC